MVTNEAEKRRQVTLLDHIFLFKNVGKDATIPDQAALRTAVAQKVLEQVGSPSLAGSGVCNFPAKQRLLLAKVPSTERLSYEVPRPVVAAVVVVVVLVVVGGSLLLAQGLDRTAEAWSFFEVGKICGKLQSIGESCGVFPSFFFLKKIRCCSLFVMLVMVVVPATRILAMSRILVPVDS